MKLVPKNIKIDFSPVVGGDNLSIVFNNNTKILYYDDWYEPPHAVVGNVTNENFVKYKLIPIKKEDLKIGYTYFRSNDKNPDFKNLSSYCKYLGNGKCAFVKDNNLVINNNKQDYWWQVVPIKKV